MGAVVSVFAQLSTFEKVLILATIVAIIFSLAYLFRRPIADLIDNIRSIEFDPSKRSVRFEFRQRIKQEQEKATGMGHPIPVVSAGDAENQNGRDVVLQAWGALRQAVYDACIANGMTVTPAVHVADAVRKLAPARGLSTELVRLIESLYELGAKVANTSGLRLSDEDAEGYATLAYNAAHWLAVSALVPSVSPGPPPPPPRRPTMVGRSFGPPSSGNADAALVAVAGPLKGQHYTIDKPTYRLGRSSNSDLCAKADASVSSNHASLHYENGGLFLYDHGSLNGTFVNEQRVTGTPAIVRQGDRIRLGESVFEVVSSAGARPGATTGETVKQPSDRSVVR